MIPHTALAAVGVAPEIPAGIIGALGLLALLGTFLALGMQKAWKETFGTFLRHLANWIDVKISIPHVHTFYPFSHAAHLIRGADQQVMNAFGWLALKGEAASAWCFTTAGHIFWWSVHETADLAGDVLTALQRTTVSTIPNAVRRAEAVTLNRLRGIDQTVGRIEAHAHALERRLLNGIDRLAHRVTAEIGQAEHALTARVGITSRQIRRLARRTTRVERLLGASALTAAVAVALERLGLRWLRCPALGRAGRKIGCRGFGLLEDLLAVSFAPLLLTDACKLVHEIERLAIKAQPAIDAFVLGIEGFLCGGPSSLPSAIEPSDLERVAALPTGL